MVLPQVTGSTRRDARAAVYLYVYARMGPDRSLRALAEFCRSDGVSKAFPDLRVSLTTLETYSKVYNWQEAIEEFDREAALATYDATISDAIVRDVRDAQLVGLLKDAGEQALRERVKPEGERLGDAAAVRAIVDGIRYGRLISGEATEIHQFYLSVYDAIGRGVTDAFVEARETALARLAPLLPEGSEDVLDEVRSESGDIWGMRVEMIIIEHFRTLGAEVEVA